MSDPLRDACTADGRYSFDAYRFLFEALETTVIATEARQLVRCPFHVNDAEFAAALVDAWRDIAE